MIIGPKVMRCGLVLIVIGLGFTILTGCEQPLKENETLHMTMFIWPFLDVERWKGINPEDGTSWKKERGDAICWLSTWEKEQRFDKDGFPIYRKERSTFLPLWSTQIEESEAFINKKGSVLVFPYDSRQRK